MLPVEAGRFVYFISVAPPKDGDPIHICHGEFQDAGRSLLEDGRIYYREKGSTRAAKSGEVKALIRRAKSAAPVVDFQVEVVAGAARRYAAEDTCSTLRKLIAVRAEKISAGWHGNAESLEERLGSLRERAEVEWIDNLDKLASAAWPGVCFELDNTADTYLKNIAVTLTFPRGVEGLDKNDADSITITDLVPSLYETPDLFGLRSPMDIDWLNLHRASASSRLRWENVDGVLIVVIEGMDLRPETPWTNDDDDLVIMIRDPSVDSVTAEWHLTAEGHDRAYSGTVEIPIVNASVVEDLQATIWRDASAATSE